MVTSFFFFFFEREKLRPTWIDFIAQLVFHTLEDKLPAKEFSLHAQKGIINSFVCWDSPFLCTMGLCHWFVIHCQGPDSEQ